MPPANTPADTPSLSPHRRLDSQLGVEAHNLLSTRHQLSYAYDENSRGARMSGSLLNRPHHHHHHHHHHRYHEQLGIFDGRPRRPGAIRARRSSRDPPDPRQPREPAYGPRIPLVRPGQQQSVYDWAPAPASASGGDDLESRSLPPIFTNDTLDEVPYPIRYSNTVIEPRTMGETQASRYAALVGAGAGDSTFRMAVMQSLRNNHPREPVRTRALHEAALERGYARERIDDSSRSRFEWGSPETTVRSRYSRSSNDPGTDSFLPLASKEVEKAIDYLSKVRACRTPEESLRLAVRTGFHDGGDWLELFEENPGCDDFVLDTLFLQAAESSWLKAGGVFWGAQVAPAMHSSEGPNRSSSSSQWSVKVSISSIDYSQLRLTGTMEAITDEREKSIPSIITYLEGEIIDFNRHSFETLNFPSSLKEDANNWRKLEPFKHMSNAELVKALVSRKSMKELTDNWVFMRWKEKCFISPDPDVGGLTIGGFYFLTMRREDGRIQGYYYDPQSQPFQELTLMPQKRLFPTYEFM